MTPEECAAACAAPIQGLGAAFMLDGPTYTRGIELGFSGMDFYFAGRCGVLGDCDADVVGAALVWFSPSLLPLWDSAKSVMAPAEAAAHFAGCCGSWARAHLDGFDGAGRLAELGGRVASAADCAGLPLFAGWRAMPLAEDKTERGLQVVNVLRERRGGLHAIAVLAAGLRPLEAVMAKGGPGNAQLFGWQAPYPDVDDRIRGAWEEAERTTTELEAPAYAVLDESERVELAELCREASAVAFG